MGLHGLSEQAVIVSGHLDSWDLGTGAIDDGAGVVMVVLAVFTLASWAAWRRLPLMLLNRVISRDREFQDRADRLDTEPAPM